MWQSRSLMTFLVVIAATNVVITGPPPFWHKTSFWNEKISRDDLSNIIFCHVIVKNDRISFKIDEFWQVHMSITYVVYLGTIYCFENFEKNSKIFKNS